MWLTADCRVWSIVCRMVQNVWPLFSSSSRSLCPDIKPCPILIRTLDHLNGEGKVSRTDCILWLFALAMAAYCCAPNPESLDISPPGEMTDWVLKSQWFSIYWSRGWDWTRYFVHATLLRPVDVLTITFSACICFKLEKWVKTNFFLYCHICNLIIPQEIHSQKIKQCIWLYRIIIFASYCHSFWRVVKYYNFNLLWAPREWRVHFETGKVGVHAACHYQNQYIETRIESSWALFSECQRSEKMAGYVPWKPS